ncbi:MAG: LytTR family DNA-binding domain-containing protein [Bacteroidota bacterium]
MIQTILIDDDELSRLNLRLICDQLPEIELCGEFENPLEALAFHQQNPVDLFLLDIEMPQLSGLDLVRSISQLPDIIFISSKENYAAVAFDYLERVIDYVVKPVSLNRIQKALERYHQAQSPAIAPATSDVTTPLPSSPFIFVKVDKKYVRIDLNDLLYVEIMGDYAIFKTTHDKYVVHQSLKHIKDELQHEHFVKVHRSFLVNISKITNIEHNSLLVADRVIPVSRTHRADLMSRLSFI